MEVITDNDNRSVYLNNDDICWNCKNRYGCPLVECLSNGLVEATSDILVKECAHYKDI